MSTAGMTPAAIVVCTLFMLIGPALIMLNQYILKAMNFPYPMTLSGIGVVASGLFSYVLILTGHVKIQRAEAIEGWLWYKRVLPVGMASAATLAFGNIVYLYLDVGFIQMLKSFTPVIIMCVGYVAKVEQATFPVIVSVFIISLGTAATCSFTPRLDAWGLFFMFLSAVTEGVRLIITQFFLQQLKFGVVESQYVLAPACAFWLFIASAIWEWPSMYEKGAHWIIFEHPLHFMIAAAMGIGVNFISYYVIQYTSSLTMKILSTVRNICLVVVGVVWYKEVITGNQSVGYGIALVGFAGYNMAKMGYFESNSSFMIELRNRFPSIFPREGKKNETEGLLLNNLV